MNKAVFLDRDGTINEDVGDFCSPEKLTFIPGAIEALKILQRDFFLFVITNQSGVGKNIFTEEELINFNPAGIPRLSRRGCEQSPARSAGQAKPERKSATPVKAWVSTMYFYSLLKDKGVILKEIYYCPHTKEQRCLCHKPISYFMKKAEEDYDIDLKNSFVVGDHPHDVEMAQAVGASAIYVLTGHGKKHIKDLSTKPDFICDNLYEDRIWITKNLLCMSNNKEVQ